MKKLTSAALALAAALTLSACGAMPHHDTVATGAAPTIDATGMPVGATVLVDGVAVGTISENQSRFATQEGTHKVLVLSPSGATLYDGTLYFSRNVTRKVSAQ